MLKIILQHSALSYFLQELLVVCLFVYCWQEVPEPLGFFVTHWSKDVWSQMSYSFVKTGGSGEAYDVLAEDVQGKVFFAGEVTASEREENWRKGPDHSFPSFLPSRPQTDTSLRLWREPTSAGSGRPARWLPCSSGLCSHQHGPPQDPNRPTHCWWTRTAW